MSEIYDDRFVPCYKCAFVGNIGVDSRDEPIAYCLLKKIIVNPDTGCKEHKSIESVGKK
jgi:hypothetical protein